MKWFKKKQLDAPRRRLADLEALSQPESSSGFKRGQTIAGDVSVSSPRSRTHHLSIKRRKVTSILLIVLLSIIVLVVLISNFTARVSVSVSSTSLARSVDNSLYEKVIQEYLDINPMGRFGFLLDQASLTSYLVGKLPEVSTVSQQGMLGVGQGNFGISLRSPVAGWVIDGKQHYVDANGISFEQNYFSQPEVQIVDDSGASLQAGAAIVSKRFLSYVGRVVSEVKDSGYTVTQAILPAGTTRELEIRLKEGGYLAKLSIDRPVGEQVEDMNRAVQYFIGLGQVPSYIDVRVSGKAFYK